jgi:selenocysteine lyase/cysteine desulfurase
LEAAVDFVQLIGMGAVESRMRFLATSLKEQLSQIGGVRLKTNLEPELSGGVVKADISRVPPKQAYDALWDKHRISIAMTPSGDAQGLRFSPHIYNSRQEIQRAAEAVKALAS